MWSESDEPDLNPKAIIWLTQLVLSEDFVSKQEIEEFTLDEARWYIWFKGKFEKQKAEKPQAQSQRYSTGSMPGEKSKGTAERKALFVKSKAKRPAEGEDNKKVLSLPPEKKQRNSANKKDQKESTEISDDVTVSSTAGRVKDANLKCHLIMFLDRDDAKDRCPSNVFEIGELVKNREALLDLDMRDINEENPEMVMSPQVLII